jgi:hypothetical protein
MGYEGGCAVNCVAGSATQGNSISGVSCCTTDKCNSSVKIKSSETTMALILIAMILSNFRLLK